MKWRHIEPCGATGAVHGAIILVPRLAITWWADLIHLQYFANNYILRKKSCIMYTNHQNKNSRLKHTLH
jgi:hypothetical protein